MSQKIALLSPSTAQKIAAGEVIDRPEAVVRELVDNAIDAGATSLELHIKKGGVDLIQLIDNGQGMGKEDLALCWSSHATSKINAFEDLESLQTMGFRGEALYSIAACAKLSITSTPKSQAVESQDPTPTHKQQGYTLTVHSGELISLEPSGQGQGTSVVVSDLFYSIPARKKFLKRPSAETNSCKKTFISKLTPFPHISGKLFVDGKLKLFLPPQSLEERVALIHNMSDTKLFHRIERSGATFSITAILGDPSLTRHDRSKIVIYLGNRPIQEYSLVQAVCYGYNTFLPGGLFPVATICIETDPKLVDVNIHPAKREVRIKNLPEIHHELSHMIKEHLGLSGRAAPSFTPGFGGTAKQAELALSQKSLSKKANFSAVPYGSAPKGWVQEARDHQAAYHAAITEDFSKSIGEEHAKKATSQIEPPMGDTLAGGTSGNSTDNNPAGDASDTPASDISDTPTGQTITGHTSTDTNLKPTQNFHYLGQLFGVFLLVEQEDKLLLIDQHATHERIIFEQLISDREPQPLLLPIAIFLDESEENLVKKQQKSYEKLGIEMVQRGKGHWEITAIPAVMHQSDSVLIDFIASQQGTTEELQKLLFAKISCTAAIKEGDYLDAERAIALIQQAFQLSQKRCPHGRPILTTISRDELYQAVGRLI